MPRKLTTKICLTAFFLSIGASLPCQAMNFEVFGKGSVSKSNLTGGDYVVSMSGAGGLALILVPQIRLEGRFTLISQSQNHMDIGWPTPVLTLADIRTRTYIYSVNVDIDILSDKHAFQPFVLVGAGYLQSTRTYTVSNYGIDNAVDAEDPKKTSVTGIAGAGFRLRLMRSLAFEIEAMAYVLDPDKPAPVIDWLGTAGIRVSF